MVLRVRTMRSKTYTLICNGMTRPASIVDAVFMCAVSIDNVLPRMSIASQIVKWYLAMVRNIQTNTEGGSMTRLSRNASVLRSLLEAAPGVGRIKLAKFAYLADLEAVRYLGRAVSGFRYVRDDFGPFDNAGFYGALAELKESGAATEQQVTYPGGYSGYLIEPTSAAFETEFSQAETEILLYVTESYKRFSGKDLCDEIVYQTEPMIGAEKGSALDLTKVREANPDPLGFNLLRMLAAESTARRGLHRPLASALSDLQAQYCA